MRLASILILLGLLVPEIPLPVKAIDDHQPSYRLKLFNGRDLCGLQISGCQVSIEKTTLVIRSSSGVIRADHRYTDFILEYDWFVPKSALGEWTVFFRDQRSGKETDYQYPLYSPQDVDVSNPGNADLEEGIQTGQWNHFKLSAVGEKAFIEINGQLRWNKIGLKEQSGYLGFLMKIPDNEAFAIRNMHITEVGFVSVFNGKDLTGWEGAGRDAALCWGVENHLLVCDGRDGPWLRSTGRYKDFSFRLEYQLESGGNSGVFLRVPKNGEHRGRGDSGVEIQILDDHDKRYRDLKAFQYAGSVYAIAAASPHVGRPAGLWNTLEINCRDTFYEVVHNGISVLEADSVGFPQLGDRRLMGFLGLQNHSEPVRFRNLRIGSVR